MPWNRARKAPAPGKAGVVTLAHYGLLDTQGRPGAQHEGRSAGKHAVADRASDRNWQSRQLVLPGEVGAVRDAPDRKISPRES